MSDHDIRSDQLAAVDKLAHTCSTAIRALDQAVDTALAETMNYLAGAQNDLAHLAGRIEQARGKLEATRLQWQGQRKVSDAKPLTESVPPPPAFLQTKLGQQSVLGSNSGKHDTTRP